jgi:hypothetical protein
MPRQRFDSGRRWSAAATATAILATFGLTPPPAAEGADYGRLERQIERVQDYQEIQNLMSRRMWYHSIGENENELALWSRKQPQNARWEQNQGCWVGMKSINRYYNTVNVQMQKANLAQLSKLNPAIRDEWPANRGIGNNAIHTLTSPLIIVADDGQSAKAMWYTIGTILTTNDGRTPQGNWIWERYGADLVKEDGQWRFLHIQVNTDFMNPMGSALQLQGEDAASVGKEGGKPPAPGPGAAGVKIPGPDIARSEYREFGATRVPKLVPRLPVPYRTLSETFQYASCGK